MKKIFTFFAIFAFFVLQTSAKEISVGAAQTKKYLPLLEGKRVALLSNHTGMVGEKHTLDIMLENGVNVVAIFSPEHGFRGDAGAGDHVANSVDEKTGVPILSLYNGKGYRPSDEDMGKFDVLVVDIQDVGLRFYTYYITMARMMDAVADFGLKMIVLDRPNPNGYYVDGPILDMKYKSGVGWLPIPVVHGMTLGELAGMINGEKWLPDGKQCDVTVIPCKNYTHKSLYQLPIAPSPNLQTMLAVYLYPSVCLFEGTPFSLGRGTDMPFMCYGHPNYKNGAKKLYEFTPKSCKAAPRPPRQDEVCYGVDLSKMRLRTARKEHFNLDFVIDAYTHSDLGDEFFTKFFEKLVGVDYIREMIQSGKTADEIETLWADDVKKFKEQRKPYLLYK